ncbi:hypothetical protein RWH43_06040 [Microbacterium sp. KSW2-21]|uniref:Uncharacterized protein n=1 Tax=Microbacterium algihabitans TaxID=3075992 RepID=A0ABU3RTT8_9MICO|nr:hypothetical protein [Microbacterium sp. KSW2-21]MDU0326316.1 hypothetical protein [Microbacterium sp. KSW2-21]
MKHVAPPGTLASTYLPDLQDLSADQRATFRIGLMARLTVAMERTARDVHGWLQGRDDPAELEDGARQFAMLLKQIKANLRPADEDFAMAAKEALDQVYAAYEERNRYVHDLLHETDLGQWSRESLEFHTPLHSTAVDEEALVDAVLAIVRANWRLIALASLVSRTHQDRDDPGITGSPADPHGWRAILENRFVLTPGGGASTTPDAYRA